MAIDVMGVLPAGVAVVVMMMVMIMAMSVMLVPALFIGFLVQPFLHIQRFSFGAEQAEVE